MIIRILTQYFSTVLIIPDKVSLFLYKTLTPEVISNNITKRFKALKPNHTRNYAAKGKEPKEPATEEPIQLKSPGFHPEKLNEEGYFTQKSKQELEELKKRAEKPSETNPEKRDE